MGIFGIVILSSLIWRSTHDCTIDVSFGGKNTSCRRRDAANANINRFKSFILSIKEGDRNKLFFIFYDFVEKLYVFLEFCKVCFIFVIENGSFFRN
jgi:hypothetical protein